MNWKMYLCAYSFRNIKMYLTECRIKQIVSVNIFLLETLKDISLLITFILFLVSSTKYYYFTIEQAAMITLLKRPTILIYIFMFVPHASFSFYITRSIHRRRYSFYIYYNLASVSTSLIYFILLIFHPIHFHLISIIYFYISFILLTILSSLNRLDQGKQNPLYVSSYTKLIQNHWTEEVYLLNYES